MLIGLLVSVAVVAAAVLLILPALATHRRRPALDLTGPEEKRRRRVRLQILLLFIVFQAIDTVQTIVRGRPSGAAVIVLVLLLVVSFGLLVVAFGIYPRRH